ncbi:hypothetical protein [Nitrosococcus watsonii]|uniref:hypothetical protein n=1 Tax=Nitrosococcus watsonii TaxID=473531 RepID=UPI000310D57C|nr:hypothetical protein [Nitrosococcus watsonii]
MKANPTEQETTDSETQKRPSFLATLSHFIHRRFIWLLLGAYAVAAWWPDWGLWIRDVSLGETTGNCSSRS